jgi:hypothetical protein
LSKLERLDVNHPPRLGCPPNCGVLIDVVGFQRDRVSWFTVVLGSCFASPFTVVRQRASSTIGYRKFAQGSTFLSLGCFYNGT